MPEPKLDWRPHWDPQNEEYLVGPRLLGAAESEPLPTIRPYSWRHLTLDQGQEGECVAFGCTEEAAARPVVVFGDPLYRKPDVRQLNQTARQFFQTVRQIDRAAGRYYDEGATSLAGAKAGQVWGWWENYYWARSAYEIAVAVGRKGPLCIGSWVYDSMFTARPENQETTYEISGRRRGGHLYVITRVDRKNGRLWTPNSWGGWGAGWLTFEAVDRLLREDGEAFIPVGRKKGHTTKPPPQ